MKTEIDAIRSRFATEVAAAYPVETQYDNAPFTPPDNSAWCRWTILLGTTGTQVSVGPPKQFRYVGVGSAEIRVVIEVGEEQALLIADTIIAAFRTVTDTGVVFRTPSPPQNKGRDGKWWLYVVDCPFYFDEYV